MPRGSKATFSPAMTSAATLPSCVALCASIGSPTTSPMAKMCGTFVRRCASTPMKPRSSTATPACSAPTSPPLGLRPTASRIRSYVCGSGALVALERHGQAVVAGLHRGHLRLQVDRGVALLDAALQRPDEVAVGPGHEPVEGLDDRDLRAEGVVDRRHLQADDPAADDQQPAGDVLQRERARAVDDARVVGQERQRDRAGADGDDRVVEADRRVADLQHVVGGERRLAMDDGRPCAAWRGRPGRRSAARRRSPSTRRARGGRSAARRTRCRARPSPRSRRRPSPRAAAPWTGCTRRSGRRHRARRSARRASSATPGRQRGRQPRSRPARSR